MHQLFFHYVLFGLLAAYPVYSYPESVIIDTDAGADDAMAILMLLSNEKVKIEAITCVQGNTGVQNVTTNVLKTLQVANRFTIPVYAGSPSGIVYNIESDHFFGYDGFGDFDFPNLETHYLLQKKHAAIALADLVKEKPGQISVIAIGPLTNLAIASLINPDFFKQVKSIFILGGSIKGGGNIGPYKEFNIYTDAEAAESFFDRVPAETPTVLLPFEPVMDIPFTMGWRQNTLGKLGNAKMDFLNKAERKTFNTPTWVGFDPSLAAVFLNPAVVNSLSKGRPVVNTTTNRGAMTVNLGMGSVIVITSLDRVMLKKTLIANLS